MSKSSNKNENKLIFRISEQKLVQCDRSRLGGSMLTAVLQCRSQQYRQRWMVFGADDRLFDKTKPID